MKSTHILSAMERKLDELISNAALLRECEEEKGECAQLEHQQDRLLNELLKMNTSLDDAEKQALLQQTPRHYSLLEEKVMSLSRMNRRLLRPSNEKFVKKARVHRRKIKKPPTQLSLDLN